MEADDLLCSRNARSRTPLVGRAQWKINQPPSLRDNSELGRCGAGACGAFFAPGARTLRRMGRERPGAILARRTRTIKRMGRTPTLVCAPGTRVLRRASFDGRTLTNMGALPREGKQASLEGSIRKRCSFDAHSKGQPRPLPLVDVSDLQKRLPAHIYFLFHSNGGILYGTV